MISPKVFVQIRAWLLISLLGVALSPWDGQRTAARSIEGNPAPQLAQAQQNEPGNELGQSSTPLGSVLNTDGTLNLGSDFSGSLDSEGWQMQTGADGKPRFVQADRASKGPKPQAQQPLIAGDENWDDRFGEGTNRAVDTVAVSGGDVYVGSNFTLIMGKQINYIARWNSSTNIWSALGGGIGSGFSNRVSAIAISGTDVYVGGYFTTAGGVAVSNIARWNTSTSTWSALGSGTNCCVAALTISGTDVYVGGNFTTAGGVSANNIARWNTGTNTWSALGSGTGGSFSPYVSAIAISGTDVYVGGDFTTAGGITVNNIARWNTGTSTWSALNGGTNDTVYAIAISGTNVYVGGYFTNYNHIARWNSSTNMWSALGSGISAAVDALAISGTDLYVGGNFTFAGGVSANNIARWNTSTSTWSALGSGVSHGAYAIAISGTDVYVGGYITAAGGVPYIHVARWNTGTSTWSALGSGTSGTNGSVGAIAVSGADVYAGGGFTIAGDISTNSIAKWNSSTSTWSALGSGTSGPSASVNAIAISSTNVYVGGSFTTAGGIPANYIAKWNSSTSTWSALGSGTGGSISPFVYDIAISGTDVYVGGGFTTAGGVSANHIAKWNSSTNTWSALGSGTSGGNNGDVLAIATTGTDVYVGGGFTTAGGIPANYIARWNSSTNTWSALGSGTAGTINDIATTGADVYAGGFFTTAGGVAANYIASWNIGTGTWSALGSGTGGGQFPYVNAVAVSGSNVYVGGNFTTAGGVSASRIAKWNTGTGTWSALGSGTNNPVYTLAASGLDVYAGGGFTAAGGKSSTYIGIWHEPFMLGPDYAVTSSTGATIVPANTYVPGSTCNSCTVAITLPFTYNFYGTAYNSVNASNKGNLQFGSSNASGANVCLPNAGMTDAIYAYWDDLNTNINDSMGIFTSISGAAPNRIFNIRWSGGFESNDARVAFEVRLYEGLPKFDVIYGQTRGGGFSTTVGVQQGTGVHFTQYACNTTNSVPAGTMLTFDQRIFP